MKNLNEKVYNTVLQETHDYFKSQGISIIGEGFKEIATNPALLESYVESLVEGSSPDSAAIMGQLMANANTHILTEGALGGIAPIASLSMPVIRKLWPKFTLKDALKTEVAKTPRFAITYMRPFMWSADNAKIYLPYGLKSNNMDTTDSLKTSIIGQTINQVTGTVVAGNFNLAAATFALNGAVDASNDGLLTVSGGASATTWQPLDTDFRLYSITTNDDVAYALTAGGDLVAGHTVSVRRPVKLINERLAVNNTIIYDFVISAVTLTDKAFLLTSKYVSGEQTFAALYGQIIVRANLEKGTATVAYLVDATASAGANANLVNINLKAFVSQEYNENGYSVSFDIERRDVNVGPGVHLNAPLQIESLTDMMALYQIDGTKETVDLMTNTFAMNLDKDVMQFIGASFTNQPGVQEFQTGQYPSSDAYSLSFDVRPAAGFAGSPKAWREELKPMIDFLAQKIKNNTYLQSGMFTLIGNPLDIQLLTNIDWQFRGSQGVSMDGVDVDYSVGSYVGANAYRVLSSVNVTPATLWIVFTPSSDTQMTYKYYPYTFNTEMGYIDPNRSKTPSIMMTKRHTFQEFLPAAGIINIINHDGTGQFSQGYAPYDSQPGFTS